MSKLINNFIDAISNTPHEIKLAHCISELKEDSHEKVIIYDVSDEFFIETLVASMITKHNIIVISSKCSKVEVIDLLLIHHEKAIIITSHDDVLSSINLEGLMPILNIRKGVNETKKEYVRQIPYHPYYKLHLFNENSVESVFTEEHVEKLYSEMDHTFVSNGIQSFNTKFFTCIQNTEDYFLYELFSIIKNGHSLRIYPFNIHRKDITDKSVTYSKKVEKVLFIEHNILLRKLDFILTDLFQSKMMFDAFFTNKLMEKLIISFVSKRLKIKGFKKIIILGMPTNDILIRSLSKWKKIKVFNIFGETNRLMFNSFSDKIGLIKLYNNNCQLLFDIRKKNILFGRLIIPDLVNEDKNISSTCYFMQDQRSDRNYATYCGYMFPLTREFPHNVESLINRVPFIKDCLLLRIGKENVLLYDLNIDILERAHYGLYDIRKSIKDYVLFINKTYLNEHTQIHRMREMPEQGKRYSRFDTLNRKEIYKIEVYKNLE